MVENGRTAECRSTNSTGDEIETDRGTWRNKAEFMLSCLGFCVGYGNMWRFPYICYKNGGAAFLIPYYIMNFLVGLPIFVLELTVGQYSSLGPVALFKKLCPLTCGVGWGMIILNFIAALNYNMIIGWSIFYFLASFSSPLPWSHCDNDFNSAECYSAADAKLCKTETPFYFNKTCMSVDDYCGMAKFTKFNLTHCDHPENGAILANSILPRVSSVEDYFKNRMLRSRGRSWDDMGGLQWELVGCIAVAWSLVAFVIIKGIKSLGRVSYFTSTLPYFILLVLLIRGVTLDGAYQGILFYILNPNISKLTELEVWSDAALQVFYSTSVCYGIHITFGSYNKFNNNSMRDAIAINTMSTSTSVLAGFVIFSVLGFLAQELGVNVEDVVSSGSALVFVVYPAALALLPLPQLWSALFFMMLVTVGLSSMSPIVETVTSTLYDLLPSLRQKKSQVSLATCFIMFLLSLTMCLEGGIFMFELFYWFTAGLALFVLGFCEVICILFIYGYKKLLDNIKEMEIRMPWYLKYYWIIAWCFIDPVLIIIMISLYLYNFVPVYLEDYVFPTSIQILGWLINLTGLACIPIGIVVACYQKDKWGDLLKISNDLRPITAQIYKAVNHWNVCKWILTPPQLLTSSDATRTTAVDVSNRKGFPAANLSRLGGVHGDFEGFVRHEDICKELLCYTYRFASEYPALDIMLASREVGW